MVKPHIVRGTYCSPCLNFWTGISSRFCSKVLWELKQSLKPSPVWMVKPPCYGGFPPRQPKFGQNGGGGRLWSPLPRHIRIGENQSMQHIYFCGSGSTACSVADGWTNSHLAKSVQDCLGQIITGQVRTGVVDIGLDRPDQTKTGQDGSI